MSLEDRLAESVFAKNARIVVHGSTPNQALIGRTPQLLREFENPGVSMVADDLGGREGHSRHSVRLREVALQQMIEGTAQDRLKRASQSQARVSGEAPLLKPGDHVDIFRQPSQKDQSGWRGPAEIINVNNIEDGLVEVRWGGRAMSCRIGDVRRALTYVSLMENSDPAMSILRMHLREQAPGTETHSLLFTDRACNCPRQPVKIPLSSEQHLRLVQTTSLSAALVAEPAKKSRPSEVCLDLMSVCCFGIPVQLQRCTAQSDILVLYLST